MNDKYLNELSKKIHSDNVAMGWYEGEVCVHTKMQLVSTEIAEATEGERKGLMDDHLAHRIMGEVELSDALIRVLDLGGYLGLEYESLEYEMPFLLKECPIAKQHLGLNVLLVDFTKCHFIESPKLNLLYSALVSGILKVAKNKKYNIALAMSEKLAYNKKRADHKLENRAKKNGKSF
jgi:hypothetical protein